jgi:hypothetical protein
LARTVVFAFLASLIVLGPFAAQILEMRSPLLRPWTMFSGVGVGILKGVFTHERADGSRADMTPLQVRGLDRYPVIRGTQFQYLVSDDRDLRRFAGDYCDQVGGALAFNGWVGTRTGWRSLEAQNICDGPLDREERRSDG